jgi:hypothetical protein
MAEKEQFESLTGIETDVQIEERTRHAIGRFHPANGRPERNLRQQRWLIIA